MNTAFACTKVATPSEYFSRPPPRQRRHRVGRYNRSVTWLNALVNRRAMSFELGKVALRGDCERQEKLLAFEAMDDTLRLFWERGVEPGIESIVNEGKHPEDQRLVSQCRRKDCH